MTRQGTLTAFNAGTFRADVQLAGSLNLYLTGVPVSRAIAAADMINGRKVLIEQNDAGNADDQVLTAVWT